MTYRNDHEAAIARIDVLEHELAELRATPAPAPAELLAPRHRHRTGLVLGMCTLGLAGGIIGGFVLGAPAGRPRPHQVALSSPASPARNLVLWCANEIQHAPRRTTAYTDPQGSHDLTIEPVVETGTPCRDELNQYIGTPELSPDEREALWQWALGEDELAGTSSRIAVYYTNDPDKLDHYATAPQLWREYDRALYVRDRAVVRWRETYTR